MALTVHDIEALLDAGRDDQIVGESESTNLDFKAQPYVLSGNRGKWELAKDVAALANSGGGGLVIGFETTTPEDREDEVASAVKPFPSHLADVKRHRDAIDVASGIYPVLRDVQIRRFPRSDGGALMLIRVPEQASDDLPFLVVRMVEDDERRGIGVGVPFRSGAQTYWEPPGQLHRDLSYGRTARASSERRPPETPDKPVAASDVPETRSDRRLKEIEQFMGWSDAPTLLLGAIPEHVQAVPIDGFYDRQRVRGCIETPPELRHAGFGLGWSSPAENVDGSLVNATAERQVLWADPDGAVFAACTGQQTFLTRSGGTRVANQPEARSINPTVLVEWTYLFCALVSDCLRPAVDGGIQLAVRLRGAQSRPWSLRLLPGQAPDVWGDGIPPGLDDWYFELPATFEAERDAFVLLTQIYRVFGQPDTGIPYCTDGRVDTQQIQAIR